MICALVTLVSAAPVLTAEEKDPLDVKAVWLRNFSVFVNWPEGRFADKKSPFVLGVIGENPFGKRLDELASRSQMKKREVKVRVITDLKEIRHCHMLCVSASESERLAEIAREAEQSNVLTVSDMTEFAAKGGMIQLCQQGNQIRFEINLQKGLAAKLVFDSRLCQMAKPCGEKATP
jgi:hypothetical protein